MALKDRVRNSWGIGRGFVVLVSFILVYAALSAAHMIWVKESVGFEAYLGEGPRLPPKLLIANQLIKAAALMGVVWLIALKANGLDWRAVGYRLCHAGWLAAASGIAIAGTAANLVIAKAVIAAMPEWAPMTASRYGLHDGPASEIALLVFLTAIVTPLAEETFFRGFLFQWMTGRMPVAAAMLASSLMFAASHIVPLQILVAAVMSLLILALFIASRSIWPCIVCHSFNNALGVAAGFAASEGWLPAALTPPG